MAPWFGVRTRVLALAFIAVGGKRLHAALVRSMKHDRERMEEKP